VQEYDQAERIFPLAVRELSYHAAVDVILYLPVTWELEPGAAARPSYVKVLAL